MDKFLHPTLVPDRTKCSVEKVCNPQLILALYHFSLCASLEMVIFCSVRPGCLAQFPKLAVSSSKLTVILAPSPAITCDQHLGFLREGQKYHNP